MKRIVLIVAAGAMLAGCQKKPHAETAGSEVVITELSAEEIPAEVSTLVMANVEGIEILGAERKERDGKVYFDVEGELDGAEIELDVLMTEDGPAVVEIQRDLDWSDVPLEVSEAFGGTDAEWVPVRVIESKQTDGSVIYELFEDGKPADPAMEIHVVNGQAEVLAERWEH